MLIAVAWMLTIVAWLFVPIAMLVLFMLGVLWRRRSPAWLPTLATLLLLVLVVESALRLLTDVDASYPPWINLSWSLAALACLAPAVIGAARGWRSRGLLVVAGLALPAPLMAWLIAVSVGVLVFHQGA
jgi:hypothetical protein